MAHESSEHKMMMLPNEISLAEKGKKFAWHEWESCSTWRRQWGFFMPLGSQKRSVIISNGHMKQKVLLLVHTHGHYVIHLCCRNEQRHIISRGSLALATLSLSSIFMHHATCRIRFRHKSLTLSLSVFILCVPFLTQKFWVQYNYNWQGQVFSKFSFETNWCLLGHRDFFRMNWHFLWHFDAILDRFETFDIL